MTLSALLSDRAKKAPRKLCIKFEGKKFSYSEIDNLVTLSAGGLKAIGLKPGERAAILMGNCPQYIISYFAILRAGGISVPLNTFLTPDETTYILRDCNAAILICDKTYSSHGEKLKKNLPQMQVLDFNDIPQQETEPYSGSDKETAIFLYTSGTTGFPKGAMLTHKNLISNAEASVKAMEVSRSDRFLLFLPLFHSFAFTTCVLVPIYSGASIVLLKSVKPFSMVIKSIFKDRITLFAAVPTIYNILSRKKMPFPIKYLLKFLINIRVCISGAAALPADTIRAFESRFKVPLIEGYGLTEASPAVSVNPLKGVRKPSSVGLSLPGVEVAVVGEDGIKVPAGETGELIVKGPNVMKGYFNKEEETRNTIKDGRLYTGDMARIDKEGYIYIVDRKKDVIIIDGMNVYPREIEDVVMEHPLVEESAMVGIPDNRGSEISILFVKKRDDAIAEERELRDHLKGKVAPFKVPRKIIFIEEFPKTATGKIRKNELRKSKL